MLRMMSLLLASLFSISAVANPTYRILSTATDFRGTTHTRVQQTYLGYPVWGGEAVIHQPKNSLKTTMSGQFYQHIHLPKLASLHQANAYNTALKLYQSERATRFDVSHPVTQLIVYMNERAEAHWAYYIRFKATAMHALPAFPVYVIDAQSLQVLSHWNDIKTAKAEVPASGMGGNERIGKLFYDGLPGNRTLLTMMRDPIAQWCYLENSTVTIYDRMHGDSVPKFKCSNTDPQHNNSYWNVLNDAINGSYSPNNDALYSNYVVRDMYLKWFNINMLDDHGKPMHVNFFTHDRTLGDNAYYESGEMYFGDGNKESYSVAAPSVVAHEMSHGFTEQHSNLRYHAQSGGLNESFSDMADKALEYYLTGSNNWDIDAELVKPGGKMIRYMDEPTKDCEGRAPGDHCSIDHVKDYKRGMNVHFSSGVFNKAFALLAGKWNTHRAFQVMVQANLYYWTASSTFSQAACGVVSAARDYHYKLQDVKDALLAVGVKADKC